LFVHYLFHEASTAYKLNALPHREYRMPHDLLTLAERSGYRQTGRTDEVQRLCAAFAATWPDAVRAIEFGRSSEGRAMQALIVTRTGHFSAQSLKAASIPVCMLQAGIHPGESDGKDAGFIALRELLQTQGDAQLLQKIAIVFVPAFNTDGHERMARCNRPNQNGPQETGWRVTALNLNLNRDYTKADTPEMQALLRLINEWDPLVCADLHVTDGADFQPDISLQAEPINQGDPQLYASAVQLRDRIIAQLSAQGAMPLAFYPDLYRTDDPSSGFVLTVYSPRFSTGYFPQRNRFTLLVETHSWKDYRSRVHLTRNTILSLVQQLAAHGAQWLQQAHRADSQAGRIADAEVVLDYRSSWREPGRSSADASPTHATPSHATGADAAVTLIDFPGYAYTRARSPVSGTLFTTYDPSTPRNWRVPYRDRVEPAVVVRAPKAGYLIPVAYAAQIGTKLTLHGIGYERLEAHSDAIVAELFRATQVQFSATPFEGRLRALLTGHWHERTHSLRAGSLYVPLAQPLARLVLALLEPQAPDSFAAWGFFNACFEQKEQLEPYVAEQIAQQMRQADPALEAQFQDRLQHEPAFAADPAARLEFFVRRHASWDERHNEYPIARVASRPAARYDVPGSKRSETNPS
jgi:Zinc carboxypeptidase